MMNSGNAHSLPDSYTAANIASLLQNPVVIKGAPIKPSPAAHINAYVFFICLRRPPMSVMNLEPTICNSEPAAINRDALNIAWEIRW